MRHASAPVVCTLACALLSAASSAAAGAAGDGRTEVELRLVPNAQPGVPRGVAQIRLDRDGEGSTPFANASGKLLVRLKDDKVFCDSDGDGKIDAADGEGVASPRPGMRGDEPPVLRPTAKIAGRDEEYPLTVFYAQRGIVVLGSGAHLEGKLGGSTVELYDTNVNGSFTDVGTDGMSVRDEGEAAAFAPFGPQLSKLGRVVASGGELFNVEVARGGAALGLAPYTGERATLTLGAKEPVVAAVLMLAHVDGLFTCSATSKEATTLPAGRYRAQRSVLVLRPPGDERPAAEIAEAAFGDQPAAPVLVGDSGDREPFTVRPGENALSPGPPLSLEFTARAAPGRRKIEVTDAAVVGGMGERYRAQVYTADLEGSLTVSVRAGGREKELSKLEYG